MMKNKEAGCVLKEKWGGEEQHEEYAYGSE